jgi:hypothetical protein
MRRAHAQTIPKDPENSRDQDSHGHCFGLETKISGAFPP